MPRGTEWALKDGKRVRALDHHPDKAKEEERHQKMKGRPAPLQPLFIAIVTEAAKSASFEESYELRAAHGRLPTADAAHHQAEPHFRAPEKKHNLTDKKIHNFGYVTASESMLPCPCYSAASTPIRRI